MKCKVYGMWYERLESGYGKIADIYSGFTMCQALCYVVWYSNFFHLQLSKEVGTVVLVSQMKTLRYWTQLRNGRTTT